MVSVPWNKFQKIDGVCRQYTHKHCTYSAVQARTHRTRLAQELHNIFVRLKRVCHLVRTCLTLCCSRTCRAPRAHLLPHSLFLLPRHQNTHYNRDTAIYSKNTQCIINLSRVSQLTSSAIKNHSGVNPLPFWLKAIDRVFLMTGWVCQWKPFLVPVGDACQKAYLEEWQRVDDGSMRDPDENFIKTVPRAADSIRQRRAENSDCAIKYEQPWDTSSAPKSSSQAVGQLDAPTWKLSGTEDTSDFWENRRRLFVHPKQLSPFPERLKLPYPDEEILSGYEEDVSFIRDGFTTWVEADSNITLERHVVDVRKALAEYREASARRHDTPAQQFFLRHQRAKPLIRSNEAQKHSRFCRCTSVTFTPRNVA